MFYFIAFFFNCHNVTIEGFHYVGSAQNEWFRPEISMVYFHIRGTCAYQGESKNALFYSLHIHANRAFLFTRFWTLKMILASFFW